MLGVTIRNTSKSDYNDILNICYRTGYMGEDLTGSGRFNDRKLFGYLFCLYYPLYEPEYGFVAINKEENRVIGYILGTADSKRQEQRFAYKMLWRIVLRALFYTAWRHTESFRTVIAFVRNIDRSQEPKGLESEYPAHLHIDILPEYHGKGIGTALIRTFEEYMRRNGVPGIHLRTSNKNLKAVPFYKKNGYKLIYEKDSRFWGQVDGYRNLIFAKKLDVRDVLETGSWE